MSYYPSLNEPFDPKKYGVNMQALNSLMGFSWERFVERVDPYGERLSYKQVESTIIGFQEDWVRVQDAGESDHSYISYHDLLHLTEDTVCRNAIYRFMGAVKRHRKLTDPTEYDIYALIDPRNNVIRYVGLSYNTHARYLQHTRSSTPNNPRKDAWINELKVQNLLPTLHILEHVTGKYYAIRRETYWIRHLANQGAPLTNIADTWDIETARVEDEL